MAKRLEKAKELAKAGKVKRVEGAKAWVVENGNGSKFYLVRNGSCTCPDFHQRRELHKGWCKHRLAVELVKKNGKREEGRGKREEGRGKREEGRGKREEGREALPLF